MTLPLQYRLVSSGDLSLFADLLVISSFEEYARSANGLQFASGIVEVLTVIVVFIVQYFFGAGNTLCLCLFTVS